jgi:phage shock protein A
VATTTAEQAAQRTKTLETTVQGQAQALQAAAGVAVDHLRQALIKQAQQIADVVAGLEQRMPSARNGGGTDKLRGSDRGASSSCRRSSRARLWPRSTPSSASG